MNLTHKQEAFCAALAHCGDVAEAYRRVYATDGLSPRAVEGRARALLARDAVAARVALLRSAAPVPPPPPVAVAAVAPEVPGTGQANPATPPDPAVPADAATPATAPAAPAGAACGTLTLETHLTTLAMLRDLALEAEKYSSAIQAEISRGRAAGLYTDRLQAGTGGQDGAAMQEELIITFVRADHD